MAIRPGNLTIVPTDYTAFADSMAEEIEEQLNALLALDGLATLPGDAGDREVRDRRRLFVAIARAVVKHLHEQSTSINVDVPDGVGGTITVHPTFVIEGL
jgi:hypothetical protein